MKHCANCGMMIGDNALFCSNCGAKQASQPSGFQQNPSANGTNVPPYNANTPYNQNTPNNQRTTYVNGQPTYVNGQPQYTTGSASADAPSTGFAVLGFFFPIIGLILYLMWKDQTPLKARSVGKGALIGFIVNVVLLIGNGFLSAMFSI